MYQGNRILFPGATLTVTGSTATAVYLLPAVTGTQAQVSSTVPAGGGIKIADLAPTAGVCTQANITDTRTFAQVTELDFELCKADIFVPVKESGQGNNVKRTMYMERVYVNNLDLGFQVNGVASASYRLETDNKRWFLNDSAQMIVDEYKLTATPTVTLSQTPWILANGKKILKAVKNGVELVEGTDFTVTGTTMTLTPTPTAGDLLKVRYTSATGGRLFSPVPALEDPHPELAGGVKEGQIELYLVDKAGTPDATRTARVQSARISVPLQRDQLDELGSSFPYERPMQLPVNVSVSLELKDSDLEMMARFAGYSDINTVDEIALSDLVKDKGLLIKIFRETDVKRAKLPAGHPDKYAIKSVYVRNLIPQSESWDVRVDSDATQSFEFLAHNVLISDKVTLAMP
jgi:hypothetical protein